MGRAHCGVALVLASSAVLAAATPSSAATTRPIAAAPAVAYPLAISSNRRYLVDRRGRPFFIVGDAPQSMVGNLSVKDAGAYIADRKRTGFNALWVSLLCASYNNCHSDGTTFDGIRPFTTPGDLSTPNPAYFARADAMIRLAAKAGIVVFLDPIETGSWLAVLRANGLAKARAYGRFVGARYARFPNIVWLSGNDFQTWKNPADDALVLAVAKGIRSVDRTHLQTSELNYFKSTSLDDPRWRSVLGIDAAYTYYPTYAEVLRAYNRRDHLPVCMIEAGYEFEQNLPWISAGTPVTLRREAYWSVLSGSAGDFYGNHYIWSFSSGWQDHLDTPGAAQMGRLAALFERRAWYRLVPDQRHRVVTAGYGTFTSSGSVGSSDYVTTAATPDGTLAVSYLPAGGTLTVDLGRFAGRVTAQWYDPSTGTYKPAAGSPFKAAGTASLTAPGANADGDPDWVLVLTAR